MRPAAAALVLLISLAGCEEARFVEADPPRIEELWSTDLGGPDDVFNAPLTIGCDGALLAASTALGRMGNVHTLVVDGRGLDPQAPWPRHLHDARNSGNAGTPVDCP